MGYKLKRMKSGILHARWTIANVRRQRSTGERIHAKAHRVAKRLYEAALAESEGRKPSCTLGELATEWLDLNSHSVSGSHWDAMEQFTRLHFGPLLGLDLKEITTEEVKAALNAYRKDHSEASGIQWRRYLRRLFGWALDTGRIQHLPWNQKSLGKMKYRLVPRAILPVDKWNPWLQALDAAAGCPGRPAENPRCLIARLLLATGVREMEAVKARWEWFNWTLHTYTPGLTKGGEAQARALPGWLVDILLPLKKASGWAFPDPENGRPLGRGCCRRLIQAANQVAETPGIMHHRLRATVATHLQRRVGIRDAQEAMAHKDAATTMIYTEQDPKAVREALDELGRQAGMG